MSFVDHLPIVPVVLPLVAGALTLLLDERRIAHVEDVAQAAAPDVARQQLQERSEIPALDPLPAVELPDNRAQPVAEFRDAVEEVLDLACHHRQDRRRRATTRRHVEGRADRDGERPV